MKNKFSENYYNLIKIYADLHNNGTDWDDAKDTFEIDVYLNISSSADAGGKAILTITGTC